MSHNTYLERYAWKERLFPDFQVSQRIDLIIVIPVYKEKGLLRALDSINACTRPKGSVLIIALINESEDDTTEAKEINQACIELLNNYTSRFELLYSYLRLPAKKAGVGLARKIGMDEAARILTSQDHDGLIICFDADCRCEKNYLIEIETNFRDPKVRAGVVFYQHELEGKNRDAILNYELYLRYYIDAIRYTKFPFAHQTLGSCIVVRSSTYQSEGGMNTRKAGEDFYFLNKVIPLGGFTEVNSTTIYPSDRVSDRVPFGTGKAVGQLLNSNEPYQVYHPSSFEDLRVLFSQVSSYWTGTFQCVPSSIQQFFNGNFEDEVAQIRKQTKTIETFTQRFFLWFDAFRILKYVHFARDEHYPNVPIEQALDWLASVTKINLPTTKVQQLITLREVDRGFSNEIK